ncbi:MAG: cytochrome c biogenesis protein CcsA [Spirochaetes bacterium]|nr:cytochrome c biogenesis protein CcsA [Spirochaetota bacterium]
MYFGNVLIYFSIAMSVVSLICFIFNTTNKKSVRKSAERFFFASGISLAVASVLLFAAFLTDRFDLNYVYGYSSKDLPLMYKFAGFWAGQEGTFLLWTLLLSIFGYLIIRTNDDNEDILMSVISVTKIFILVVMTIHSPFRLIWDAAPEQFKPGLIPIDGTGLNPLLQNPWMMIHPPVLFVGYASATIPFAYAVSALIRKEYSIWAEAAYRWVVLCMTTLGIGIFLGGYWAYLVLGWGGYWGWDPVENSSLIPWLILVALMHGLIIQKRKQALLRTNILLAVISFVLIFYGTFLTRSGVLSDFSVHSFGDLGLSGYLIFFIVFFLAVGTGLFAVRFKSIHSKPLGENIFTADNLINYGIITLSFYAFVILVGTSMPIISKLFMPEPTSVTNKFYNTVSIPLGILILLFLILAGLFQFLKNISKRNIIIIAVASVLLGILLNAHYSIDVFAYTFSIISFFLIIQSAADIIKYKIKPVISSRLTHIGVSVLVLGLVTSNMHSSSVQKMLTQDEEEIIENIGLTFKNFNSSLKSTLVFDYKSDNETNKIETAYYTDMKTNSLYKEPYIDYGVNRDIYITPVQYQSGEDGRGWALLGAGEEKEVEGLKMKFTGFEVDRAKMMAGTPVIYAKLDMAMNGKIYKLSPGVQVLGQDTKENIDVKIPGTSRIVSLQSWDISTKKIEIYVEPAGESAAVKDTVIVEVSFKRLIWLVWLGTVIIAIGGIYAYRRAVLKN